VKTSRQLMLLDCPSEYKAGLQMNSSEVTHPATKESAMLLYCDCYNTTADVLYMKGVRPHSRLTTSTGKVIYQCHYCSWTRTRAAGMESGLKVKAA